MKSWIFFLIGIMINLCSWAQDDPYLYIHSYDNQSFNVRIGHQIYQSDSAGRVVIPQLPASQLQISVILSRQTGIAPLFTVDLTRQDQFRWNLHRQQEQWVLSNTVTNEVLNPLMTAGTDDWWNGSRKTNSSFASMMAAIVNDSAVLYTTNKIIPSAGVGTIATRLQAPQSVVPEATVSHNTISPKDTTAQHTVVADTVATVAATIETAVPDTMTTVAATQLQPLPEVKVPAAELSPSATVVLITEEVQANALKQVYQLKNSSGTEEIELYIPLNKEEVAAEPAAAEPAIPASNDKDAANRMVLYNSDCNGVATEADIDKYRVKLLTLDVQQRLVQMNKYVRVKCLTTAQIKALSELFVTDDEKLSFFELTYPFVYDSASFKELVTLLQGELNIKKFKQMTRMQ